MGYESFFTLNNPEITGANTLGIIAGYEEGVRLVYTAKDWNAGVAFTDSTLNSKAGGAFKGDTEVKDDYGVEAYLSYSGMPRSPRCSLLR